MELSVLQYNMGLLDTLRSIVSGGGDELTYSYQCGDCGTKFKSSARHPRDAQCDECGSDKIHSGA